jgi:predicted RNA-binding protein YlqC (UPF0109 family)
VSETSGPFAVPNFSQPNETEDEEYDSDEFEVDERDADEPDADEPDSDVPDGDEPDVDEDTTPTAEVEDAPSEPVDGGVALSVLDHIARSIVDEPDAVVVDVSSQRGGIRLDLHVASSDMGRIIGRRGRVAQALRSVVRAAAAKDGTDATVDIVD